jgi:putative SOS response-associated peptidase YedK
LAAGVAPEGRPSWNVAPSRGVPTIVDILEDESSGSEPSRQRVLDVYRWGLVPHWAKDTKVGYKMINARAETAATKPAYRQALVRRRCLIVVDGFFEWMAPDPANPKKKVPFYFHRADGEPITFAGLYETWWDKSRSKEPDPDTFLQTCVIMTTSAGPDMVPIHDRMPVIIEHGDRDLWLDPKVEDVERISGLLIPAAGGTLVRHPISTRVNTPKNDGPDLLDPETDTEILELVGSAL